MHSEPSAGDVLWMNESLKQPPDIPYLKVIDQADKRNPGLNQRLRALRAGERRVISMKRENAAVKVPVTARLPDRGAGTQTGGLSEHQ
jgi:hypothetical protein